MEPKIEGWKREIDRKLSLYLPLPSKEPKLLASILAIVKARRKFIQKVVLLPNDFPFFVAHEL